MQANEGRVMEGREEDQPAGSSSAAAAPVAAEMTPTQRAISLLLAVPPQPREGQLPVDAIATLQQMECRQLPLEIKAGRFKLSEHPGTCCFDAAASTWSAHRLCRRCTAFNQVVRASERDTSSGIVNGIVANSLSLTTCSSDTQRCGQLARLPWELIELVVDYAVEDMETTKIGVTVAALLHVSSSLRYKIVKMFEPVRLYEASMRLEQQNVQQYLPEEVVRFIIPAIRWHLQDISAQRHSSEALPQWHHDEQLLFSSGLPVRDAVVALIVKTNKMDPEPFNTPQLSQCALKSEDHDVTVELLCQDVLLALRACKSHPWIPSNGDFPPRVLSVHSRALIKGSLRDPIGSVSIKLSIRLGPDSADPAAKIVVRKWKFVTSPTCS